MALHIVFCCVLAIAMSEFPVLVLCLSGHDINQTNAVDTAKSGIEDLRENDTGEELNNRINDKKIDGVITEKRLTGGYTIEEESDERPKRESRKSNTREITTMETEELAKIGTDEMKSDEFSKEVKIKPIKNVRYGRKACAIRCKSLRNRNDRDLQRSELVDAWSKQLTVVEKIIEHMENVQRQRKSEFEDLLEDMETKKTTEKQVTKTESTTEVIPTFLSVIDETEVRTALKRDPLVRRILEMARIKREEFFREVKENNITLSEWN